jgi:hypothetical protein
MEEEETRRLESKGEEDGKDNKVRNKKMTVKGKKSRRGKE